MAAEQQVTRSVRVPATPERVWEAVTDPGQLAGWLGADRVDLDLRPGGEGLVRDLDGGDRRLVVEDVRPGEHLAFHWWPADAEGRTPAEAGATRVDITLEPAPDGTGVRVTETSPTASVLRVPAYS